MELFKKNSNLDFHSGEEKIQNELNQENYNNSLLSNHDLSNSQQNLIQTLKKKTLNTTIQTTLFTKDKFTLLFSQNLPSYQKYWRNIFPKVISPHIATDDFKIIAITDRKSELDTHPKKISLTIPAEPFIAFWKKFSTLNKNTIFNRITCIAHGKSILHIIPKEGNYVIILDWGNNIKYSSKTVNTAKEQKKTHPSKKNTDENELIKVWGKSYLKLSTQLITKSQNGMQIYIKEKNSKALTQKIKKLKKYTNMDFSVERIASMLKYMENYFQNTNQKYNSLSLAFYDHYLSIQPKDIEDNNSNNMWNLFLGEIKS